MQRNLRYSILCGCWLLAGALWAQTKDQPNALSFKMVASDYLSLDPIHKQQAGGRFFHPDDLNYAGELGYSRYINPSLNAYGGLRVGAIDAYHNLTDASDSACMNTPCNKRYYPQELAVSLETQAQYKLNNGYILKETSTWQPYVGAGLGFVYMNKRAGHFDLQLPISLGTRIKLREEFSLQIQAEYRASFIVQKQNLALSAGFVWLLPSKTEKPQPPVPTEKDSDGDGLTDNNDDCPLLAGPKELRGCPDKDGDGVVDPKDKCPEVAGPASNEGCPLPKPDTAQVAPDDLAVLQAAMRGVQFETGKAVLIAASFPILDKVAAVLNKYPLYKLQINGHTDNAGGESDNLKLSRERAKTCLEYLRSKGIAADRLSAQGFGESKPLAPNDTPEGRAQNRRVEFLLVK